MRSLIPVLCILGIGCSVVLPISNDPEEVWRYTPPESQVSFHLYHRSNLSGDDQLFIGDIDSLRSSRFNPALPTKIIIHGWTHGKDVPWVSEMREAMCASGIWNIIVTDWAPLSHTIYSEARVHTGVVARQLANFIGFLALAGGQSLEDVHLVGHSLGAQIASVAGLELQRVFNRKLGRITGLDPAAPLYEWPHVESLEEMLDPGDAAFVDVIHTNGKHLGVFFPVGHVDYYPNGGQHQPGCGFWICSHLRSCELWTASVKNPNLFQAYPYASWDDYLVGNTKNLVGVPMGIAAHPGIPPGSYFLQTDERDLENINTTTTILDSL